MTAVGPLAALARTAGAAPYYGHGHVIIRVAPQEVLPDGVNQSQGGNVAKEVRFNPPVRARQRQKDHVRK